MRTTSPARIAAYVALGIMLMATLLLGAACGAAGPGGTGGTETTVTTGATEGTVTPDGVVLAMSSLTRATSVASRADVLSAAGSIESFASDLYRILAQGNGDGNLVFSPASIVTALTMTYAGASGGTAQEMAETLHFQLRGDNLHRAFNSLDSLLESRSWAAGDEGVLVKTANSLWAQRDTAFEAVFLDTLAGNYGAGVRLVDYKTAAEAARRAINDWVAAETEDKIPDLIPAGTLDALTRLVLVNAVYLDATWASQFDPDLTKDGRFITLAGDSVTVPMMTQSNSFPFARGDGWQAVELPYLRDQLAMLMIVPDEGRFAEVESRLPDGLIGEAVAGLAGGAEVDITMPKFEFRTQAALSPALQALGMRSAFDPAAADFSAMTTQEPLFISDVIHEAYISVDEEGTEAAAATAVVMRASAAPLERVDLTIDRPFLFALRDRDTGALLFLGRVTDPAV